MNEIKETPLENASDDDLPDVLEKGYILLGYSILHPKMLIGFRLIIVILIGAAYLVSLFVPIIFSVREIIIDGSMTNVMENLQLPAGYTQVLGKVITALFQKNQLLFLITNENKFWNLSRIDDLSLKQKIKKACHSCLKLQTALIITSALAILMTQVAPFLITDLPLGSMKDIENNKKLYWTNLIVQEVGLGMYIMPVGAFDVIFTGACVKIAVQFRILGHVFKSANFMEDRGRVIEAVEHHKFLLQYTNIFKESFQFMLFTMYLSAFVILGQHMFAFNASANFDVGVIVRFFLVLGQCAFFCVIAQLLSSEAEAMADAIYHSQWYENLSSVDEKIIVTMIIIRSHVPPKLSAYGMIDINIATLGKILKFTFSMYSLLSSTK